MLSANAEAQQLNLGGPEAPEPGSSLIAPALASRLERDAERFDPDAWKADPDRQALESAQRELRLLAAQLATEAAALGTDGSHLMLAAMTLDRRLDELDTTLQSLDDRVMLQSLAHDIAEVRVDWDRGERISPEQLDRDLRFVLAQAALLRFDSPPAGQGWFSPDPIAETQGLDDVVDSLRGVGLSPGTIESLVEMQSRLKLMQLWPGYARSADAEARAVRGAAETLVGLPGWVTPEARQRIMNDFSDSITSKNTDAQMTLLRLIATQGQLIGQLGEMGPGREATRLRSRAAKALAQETADAAVSLSAAQLASETLAITAKQKGLDRDDDVLRQLRPAWRTLVPKVRNTSVSARVAAVGLLVDPTDITDPGVLASIAAQRQLAGDFRILRRLSALLRPDPDHPNRAHDAIASRLLALGKDMKDPELFDSSLMLFRQLDHELDLWDEIDRLRGPAMRVVGNRRDALTLRLDKLRETWHSAWGTPGGRGSGELLAGDLEMMAGVLHTLVDVDAFTDLTALENWPGFEMSPRVRRTVTDGLSSAVDSLVADVVRGPSPIALERSTNGLIKLRGSYGPALVAGRLARLGPENGLTLAGPIAELALGPPTHGSWMANHRDAIADICWYSAELTAAHTDDPSEQRTATKQLRAHLLWRSLRTLEAIEMDSE